MVEAEVQPNLGEPFYTTTGCVDLASVAFQYHCMHTYILPETLLQSRRHTSKTTTRTYPNRRRSG